MQRRPYAAIFVFVPIPGRIEARGFFFFADAPKGECVVVEAAAAELGESKGFSHFEGRTTTSVFVCHQLASGGLQFPKRKPAYILDERHIDRVRRGAAAAPFPCCNMFGFSFWEYPMLLETGDHPSLSALGVPNMGALADISMNTPGSGFQGFVRSLAFRPAHHGQPWASSATQRYRQSGPT